MRRSRRLAFVLASCAAIGAGVFAFAVSAGAEPVIPSCTPVNSSGNKSCAKLKVTPANAPNTLANSTLGVRVRTTYSTSDPNAGGKAKTVTLTFDNDFSVTQGTIPKCLESDVAGKTVAAAYAACGPAGKNAYLSPNGTISGRSSTTPLSGNFGGCTMVFNGPGTNKVLLYARVTLTANSVPNCATPGQASAGNATVTLIGTIANAGVGGYGKKLTVPGIDGLALPLDDFYATIKRGSFFRAKCPSGASPWKLRANWVYSGAGNPSDTHNTTQACS